MLTGEPIPAEKVAGSKVTGGTVNQTGSFTMRAEKVGAETLLAHIVHMVSEARRTRAPIQKLADKVAGWFVLAVIAIAVLAFAVWALVGPAPAPCQCAGGRDFGTHHRLPLRAGSRHADIHHRGRGPRREGGVLIKDAEALELMEKVDTLVVDKTGTLTEGKPQVQQVTALPGFTERQVLAIAASLEKLSEHPLAQAIVSRAEADKVPLRGVARFRCRHRQGCARQHRWQAGSAWATPH